MKKIVPNYGKNLLFEKETELTKEEKGMFAYFGEGSRIRPPFRILNPHLIKIGDRTSIREGAFIHAYTDLTYLLTQIDKKIKHGFRKKDYEFHPEIHIGNNVQMGRFVLISCTNSVVIEDYVLFSERIFVGDNNHTFSDSNIPVMLQPNKIGEKICIEQGSWLGIGSVVLPGTHLGRNCVVGANAVVEGKFPSHAVIASEKAKMIFRRHKLGKRKD